jgi:uncharacterized membrane protein
MNIVNWVKEHKILIAILIIGSFFRFYKMDYQSVWLDEIHTLNEANPKFSFSEMIDLMMITEPHPPLYFIFIKTVFTLFGYTTFVLRFTSVMIGIAGILALYKLGKELINKEVGLISALILSVNHFHLYHSQDGRMYALLFLTTVISTIYLAKFIKKPTFLSAFLHGFFALLMISTHFFALFMLFAHYVIFLYFIIKSSNTRSKKFIKYSFISGITTLILYLPVLKLLTASSKKTSFWIALPEVDAYTQIFKELFGFSELVLFMVVIIIVFLFIKIFNTKSEKELSINPESEKEIFSFFILTTCIICTLLIPLILSFVNLPMLVSRYFINILPAFVLLLAIGIFYIDNKLIKIFVITVLITFSVVDIIIVKKYYSNYLKSQFREVSEFIRDNNDSDDILFTSLAWYFPFFLNNDLIKTNIVDKTLEAHVVDMMQDSKNIKAFWYADAHGRPMVLSENSQKFINENFHVNESFDGFDAWTKHYILIKDAKKSISISKFLPLKTYNGAPFAFTLETVETIDNKVIIKGWAYFNDQDATESVINILLVKNDQAENFLTEKVNRPDVTSYFKSKYDLSNSGFSSTIDLSDLDFGSYSIAVYLENSSTRKIGMNISDKMVIKKD